MKKYDKEIMQAQLDNEKAVLKQLEGNYKDALEEINSKIAMLMGRADADMQHVIYQVEYQKALKKQIEGILLQLQTNEFDTVSGYLTKCYEEGFLGTMYSMQSQGVPLIFPIDQEEIAVAIQHETALKTSLYNAFDIKDLQKKIAGEISRGFSTGASYKEVARNVQAVTGISKNKAVRIARTEGHRITETAAHNAQVKAKARGADVVKIWDATLDGKTRDSHMKVDGDIKEVDEKFSNGLMFPGDPKGKASEVINCRCRSRTDARWALEAEETKMLGDTSKMTDERKKEIADKLGIPVEDLDQYSGQIVPINAKSYSDFKKQYDRLWRYEGSALQQEAEARIAKMERAKNGRNINTNNASAEDIAQYREVLEKSSEKSNKTLESSGESGKIQGVGATYPEYSRLSSGTAQDNAQKTNPNFSSGKYEYTHNCQRCVPAWELRERGFDVQAMPSKQPGEHDPIMTSPYSIWKFNAFDPDKTKRVQVDRVGNGKESIIKFLQDCGEGSRCEIVVDWMYQDEGHAFCAKNVGGEIVFIDPQTGRSGVSVEEYFDRVVPGKTTWLRIDGLDINESFRKDAVKNPYGKD